jgi:hypothetical protein
MSGNLGIVQVVANQNQKEATINAALLRIAEAITEAFDANLASSNVVVTTDQAQRCTLIRATNVTTSGRTVTVPQVERVFLAANPATSTHSVGFVRGTTTVTLLPGQSAILSTDGTANGLVEIISDARASRLSRPGGLYRSGTRVGLPTGLTYGVTNAVAADVMYAWPIPVEAPFRAASMEIQVGTLTAGVLGKLGLALPGADGLPATLLAECAAAVDFNVAANTILNATITGGVNVPAGWIWGLCVFNGAGQPVSADLASGPAAFAGHAVGNASMSGYTQRGTVGPSARVSRAHTYATAFPASLTGWTTANNVFASPAMVAVVA